MVHWVYQKQWQEICNHSQGDLMTDLKVRLGTLFEDFLNRMPDCVGISVGIYTNPDQNLLAQHSEGRMGPGVPALLKTKEFRRQEIQLTGERVLAFTLPLETEELCAALRFLVRDEGAFAHFFTHNCFQVFSQAILLVIENFEARHRLASYKREFTQSLAQTIDARDPYTRWHSLRVARYAVLLGISLGLTRQELEVIRQGALLHDIGKLAVPEPVLFKQGRLTEEEYAFIKVHPQAGADIVKSRFLQEVVPIILHHHERVDGSGYPRGLSGQDIPLGAQIVGITDVYEALTSHRVYRGALSDQQARQTMLEMQRQFDAGLLTAFFELLDRMQEHQRVRPEKAQPRDLISKGLLDYFQDDPYTVKPADSLAKLVQLDIQQVEQALNHLVQQGLLCKAVTCNGVYYYQNLDLQEQAQCQINANIAESR